jgi:hypothetical protein
MLDELLRIAKLYVHSHAYECIYQEIIHKPNWGDVMSRRGDISHTNYFGRNGKWIKYKWNYCSIWIINPDTGYFVYADYWDGISVYVVFDHKQYIPELLANLDIVIMNDHHRDGCSTLVARTYVTIYGYRHYLYFYDSPFNIDKIRLCITECSYLVIDSDKTVCYCNSKLKIEGAEPVSYKDITADKYRSIFIDCHATRVG